MKEKNIIKKEGIIYVIIDVNEKSNIPEIINNMKNVETIEYPLSSADYCVSDRTGIELKRNSDYPSSTINGDCDHNLWDQCRKMELDYLYPNVIVQGLENEIEKNQNRKKQLIGSVNSFMYKYPFHLTNSDLETARLIVKIAKYEQKEHSKGFARTQKKQKKEETQEEFDKRTREYLTQGLIDTGHEKAEILVEIFKTLDKIIEAIRLSNILYTRNNTLKGIIGPISQLKGFGPKWVIKNRRLLGFD